MKSPTSKGACWRASGWTWLPFSGMAVVASVGGAAITYCEQYFWPAAGGVSSPDPAGGATPAWLKLRHVVAVTVEPPTCDGREVRPVLLGAERIVLRGRIGARDAHRIAGAGVDRRVRVVHAEARVHLRPGAEAALGIVDLEDRAGVERQGLVRVVDRLDRAGARVQRLLRHVDEAGDLLAADDVADRVELVGRVLQRSAAHGVQKAVGDEAIDFRRAVDHVTPRQRVRRHLHDHVAGDRDRLAVDHGGSTGVRARRRRVDRGVLQEAGVVEAVKVRGGDAARRLPKPAGVGSVLTTHGAVEPAGGLAVPPLA